MWWPMPDSIVVMAGAVALWAVTGAEIDILKYWVIGAALLSVGLWMDGRRLR